MIDIGGAITIGGQIIIGDVPVFTVYFITEDDNFLISQTDQNFIIHYLPGHIVLFYDIMFFQKYLNLLPHIYAYSCFSLMP